MKENVDKNNFYYELHMHTSEGSACASSSASDMAHMFASEGYAGIVLTDHFFNGNCAISSTLPWEKRVSSFMKSYYDAIAATKEFNFDVFFGFEYNFNGTEFLIYGLDETFLYNHPDLLSWDLSTFFERVRQAGGLVSHAHPFRMASYIAETRLFPELIDAVEVINLRNSVAENLQALQYAKSHNLPQLAGSDIHNLTGKKIKVFCNHRIVDNKDLVDSIRNESLTYDHNEEENLKRILKTIT